MNVYPRQALEAAPRTGPYQWEIDSDTFKWLCTDAEFAAAFVPAERLDALIEAARAMVAWMHGPDTRPLAGLWALGRELDSALRAYDEGQEQ